MCIENENDSFRLISQCLHHELRVLTREMQFLYQFKPTIFKVQKLKADSGVKGL